ncbi:MAG: hypothetical protein AAGG46_12810, partial [Planctomycetota bacterium]
MARSRGPCHRAEETHKRRSEDAQRAGAEFRQPLGDEQKARLSQQGLGQVVPASEEPRACIKVCRHVR